MAKKKRRARAKKKNPTKKRAAHRRKRARAANPTRKRRTSHRRRAAKNPRRARRAHARRSRNPSRSRRRTRRARSMNPFSGSGGSSMKKAAIAVGAGLGAFLVTQAATYYASKDAETQSRNQKLIGAAGVALGLYLVKKRPLLGVAIAAGGALGGFGNYLILQLMRYLPQKATPRASAVAYDTLGAVAYENLGAIEYEGRGQLSMGETVYDNMAGWQAMGDPVPDAPWESANPF
jgi:hypothetical protein